MNRVLKIWLVTLLAYGAFAALLIWVVVPRGYDYGFLAPRPGWSVPAYQKRAIPLAVGGYFVVALALTFARGGQNAEAPRPAARR